MRVLLDTNAYSALMRGHDELADRVRRAEPVVLSAVVAGELLFGFRAGARLRKNLAELEAFLDNSYVSFAPVTLRHGRSVRPYCRRPPGKGAPDPHQ